MSIADLVHRARLYIRLSNQKDMEAIRALFRPDARYASTQVGEHAGWTAIEAMMRGFFERYPDAHWTVEEYEEQPGGAVEFDFRMTGIDASSGVPVERRGRETLRFDTEGLIHRIEVDVG